MTPNWPQFSRAGSCWPCRADPHLLTSSLPHLLTSSPHHLLTSSHLTPSNLLSSPLPSSPLLTSSHLTPSNLLSSPLPSSPLLSPPLHTSYPILLWWSALVCEVESSSWCSLPVVLASPVLQWQPATPHQRCSHRDPPVEDYVSF